MWEQFSNLLNFNNAPAQRPSFDFGIPTQYQGGSQFAGLPNTPVSVGSNPYQAASPDWFSFGGAFGNAQTGGWVSPALQGLQSLFSWNQGNKAFELAQDQFNLSRELAQKNLANQTALLNTAMRDRQAARRSASSSYEDPDSYMAKNAL